MTLKFVSALYASAASLAILFSGGGVEAASYSAPVEQPQQQLIAQAVYNQGTGEWIEKGFVDAYTYTSFVVNYDGTKVNRIIFGDGLAGALNLYMGGRGVWVADEGMTPEYITWHSHRNGTVVIKGDGFEASFTNGSNFEFN